LHGHHGRDAGDEDLRHEEGQCHQVGVAAAAPRRHPAADDGDEQQQPEGHQPPVGPDDEREGREDEDDAALPVEPLLPAPQGLPHEEETQVRQDEAAGQRAAEIPPQCEMQARQHEREDLVLEAPVDEESQAGHGRGVPGGYNETFDTLNWPCRTVY
jgi:hypothetical protein